MRLDIHAMLERQAAWQRSRADRPWAEKLRECASARRGLVSLKKSAPTPRQKTSDGPTES